jgi:hypothetical protein
LPVSLNAVDRTDDAAVFTLVGVRPRLAVACQVRVADLAAATTARVNDAGEVDAQKRRRQEKEYA